MCASISRVHKCVNSSVVRESPLFAFYLFIVVVCRRYFYLHEKKTKEKEREKKEKKKEKKRSADEEEEGEKRSSSNNAPLSCRNLCQLRPNSMKAAFHASALSAPNDLRHK